MLQPARQGHDPAGRGAWQGAGTFIKLLQQDQREVALAVTRPPATGHTSASSNTCKVYLEGMTQLWGLALPHAY